MKKSIDEKIIEALDLVAEEPMKVVEGEIVETTPPFVGNPEADIETDYSLVRDNLKSLIKQGQEAIDGILNIASEGEQPRAYEVVSQLLKNVVEANKELLDIHKQIKEIDGSDKPRNVTNHNSLYLGSTKELQKLLGGRKLTEINNDELET